MRFTFDDNALSPIEAILECGSGVLKIKIKKSGAVVTMRIYNSEDGISSDTEQTLVGGHGFSDWSLLYSLAYGMSAVLTKSDADESKPFENLTSEQLAAAQNYIDVATNIICLCKSE